MNLYLILALIIGWGASVGGAFFYGTGVGRDGEIAGQERISKAIEETKLQAQQGAANAISQIRITNTTVHQKAETIVRTERVYSDCRHAPGMRDTINEAITGQSQPASVGKLPASKPAGR